jgi:hypothetical protein
MEITQYPFIASYPPKIFPRPMFPAGFVNNAYGMGWEYATYRGHVMLFHGGNTIGHSGMVSDKVTIILEIY